MEAYNNELQSVLNEWEACVKSLKQLEDALVDALSTDDENEAVAKEQKMESSKHSGSQASNSKEEEDKEEGESNEEEESKEEDELVGSSRMSVKA